MPPISRLDPRYHRARGLHELNRLMSLRREQRRLQIETYQFLAQCAKRKESPCQQDNSQCVKRMRYSGPDLPEDIWHHIHSLLPLQDAARAACMVDTPTGPGKFLHLRYLRITFATWRFSWAYDYFSLASFLDASPSLETFILCISQKEKHDLTFKDPICLRQIPEHRHDKLKNVKITGFSATRSLVELICHIMENTTSLECLTLDTLCTQLRCSDGNIDVCLPLDQDVIKGVHNSLLAIRTYIEGKIPSTVKFNVREPCSRCHGWIGARYTGWLRPFIGARREQGTVVIGDRVG
uniref:At1g61320/AtMIF1 LRR domain-containing protein n=1 Tax=Oryza nivara TaxID=4536 RepID=A0A0E0GJ26_ORYNI